MLNYQDMNYPGVTYIVPETIADKFVAHMQVEGACLIQGCSSTDEQKLVVDVREDAEYWGLVCE